MPVQVESFTFGIAWAGHANGDRHADQPRRGSHESDLVAWLRKNFVPRDEFEREIKALEERLTKKLDAVTAEKLDLEGWILANQTLYAELARLLSVWPTDQAPKQ